MKKISRYSLILILIYHLYSIATLAQNIEDMSKQKPVTISGSLNFRTMFYNSKGIEKRQQPFSYMLSGSPVLSLYGFTIPFYFVYSEQERSFRQPFNQFGMSPQYKWVTINAGYRNISYSPYTMAGHTMFGAGVELTPGIFRLGFMYGRLNRATDLDTTTGSFTPYSYTRMGLAVKAGIGTGKNFINFTMIKAKDDSLSVSKILKKSEKRINPAENVVFGLNSRLTYKAFFIEGDVGLSLYTNDMNSSLKSADSLPKILTSTIGSFLHFNGTTEFYSAYDLAVGFKLKLLSLKLQYKRIDPDYKSMGAYFFNSDLRNITLTPSFTMFKQKLTFSGSIGFQRDNLQNQKETTSHRIIGSANLSTNISESFGFDASFSNFSTSQKPGRFFVSDSFMVAQTTKNFSLSPRYIINNTNVSHAFLLSWNLMDLLDLNPLTKDNNNITSTNIYINYQFAINPQHLAIYLNLNYLQMNLSSGKIGNNGVTLGGTKTFFDNKLSLGINSSTVISQNRDKSHNLIFNNGFQGTYKTGKIHSFSLNINHIANYPQSGITYDNPKYMEYRVEIVYAMNF